MAAKDKYDVLVIGVGMAGVSAAHKAARAGKKVAVVDSRPYGGTCALRGCDPKKVLVGAAELIDWNRRMNGLGVSGELTIDWPDLMKHKDSVIQGTPGALEKSMAKLGAETLHGGARFTGRNTVMVGDRELQAEHILIAVGQRPRTLSFPGAEYLITSTDFLELPELPRRIVFVGGGFVSMEFAYVAARAGAEITVLQRGEHILKGFDPELADQLAQASRELGIDVRLHAEVETVEQNSGGAGRYTVSTADGARIEADLVVHGAGRVPEIDDLDLKTGDVSFDPTRGVEVNEFLQSVSNPAVYAAGDAAATVGAKLTPVAVHEGMIAVGNILKGNRKQPNYRGTPSVCFTVPSLARAGLLEAEARAAGLDVEVSTGDMSDWYTLRRTNESHGAYKLIIDKKSGTVVGAHLLGGHAGETINMFAMAIRNGINALDLKTGVYVHPAATSDITYML
ncbi:MAG: FAD-dependent oxidoreductase [Spirochaetes bacterium]|jgi:glutathione reductase (NADPH)|nr:FAD-dependent oxidoreductase [Spirochaetota bacterium]